MTTEPKCVCGHPRNEHLDEGCLLCKCNHYRPALDWPDAEVWWWSKQTGRLVDYSPSNNQVRRDEECYTFAEDEWSALFGPDEFIRCEPNPFEAKQ